jgi:hypothetical protein
MVGYTYRDTNRWEGFMRNAVEMGSGAMIYILSFIMIGFGIQKFIWGGYTDTTDCMVIS